METYIITFSINLNNKLSSVYNSIKEYIESLEQCGSWSEKGNVLQVTKTSFLASCNKSCDNIRSDIEKIFKKYNTDGTVLVIEIKLSGWTIHTADDSEGDKSIRWMKKYISLKDN